MSKYEKLSIDVNVSKKHYDWKKEFYFEIDKAKKSLMKDLYVRYLSGGDEYKCIIKEQFIEKFKDFASAEISLYTEKVEE